MENKIIEYFTKLVGDLHMQIAFLYAENQELKKQLKGGEVDVQSTDETSDLSGQ